MDKNINVNLELTVEQVVFIINCLGDLPSKTGSWIISQSLMQQLEKQLPNEVTSDTKQSDTLQ